MAAAPLMVGEEKLGRIPFHGLQLDAGRDTKYQAALYGNRERQVVKIKINCPPEQIDALVKQTSIAAHVVGLHDQTVMVTREDGFDIQVTTIANSEAKSETMVNPEAPDLTLLGVGHHFANAVVRRPYKSEDARD